MGLRRNLFRSFRIRTMFLGSSTLKAVSVSWSFLICSILEFWIPFYSLVSPLYEKCWISTLLILSVRQVFIRFFRWLFPIKTRESALPRSFLKHFISTLRIWRSWLKLGNTVQNVWKRSGDKDRLGRNLHVNITATIK